jgi:hypothetical protein
MKGGTMSTNACDFILFILVLFGFGVVYLVGRKHGELYSESKKKSATSNNS